jgi:predicted  nucleic acid-binding Zn-ribbon protein
VEQLKELNSDISTGQGLFQSDLRSFIEDTFGNCMSSITELKTEMDDLRSEVSVLESRINDGQADMEDTSERQQIELTSIVG